MKTKIFIVLFSFFLSFKIEAQTISKGSTVTILEIGKTDSYYAERVDFIGHSATALGEFSKASTGFYSGTLELDNGRTCFFTSIKVELKKTATKPMFDSKQLFSNSIPKGTKFKILEVSADDSYYSDREEIVGKKGTTKNNLTVDEDGYTSGSIETDDGNSYYFFKVRLGKIDAKSTSSSQTTSVSSTPKPVKYITGTIKKGTAVYLADISEDDSYYSDRFDKVGQKGKIAKSDMTMKEDGYYAGDFVYDNGSTAYFYKAKFSKEPVAKLEKPKDLEVLGEDNEPITSKANDDEWDNAYQDINIKKGDKVEFTAISKEDSFYDDRADYIGEKGIAGDDIEYKEDEGGYSGTIVIDNSSESNFFYLVKLKKVSPKTTKSKEPTRTR